MFRIDYQEDENLALLQSGDSNAFSRIYFRYSKPPFHFARKNIKFQEECEKIVQDIFLDLWSRREKLGHITSVEGYLFQMVRYKVIRYFQHKGVIQKFEAHYKFFEILYESPSFELQEKEPIQNSIERCLVGLTLRCREAIRPRIFNNLSNDEIANHMSITKRTVENYMVTAFDHIRSYGDKLLKPI
jgi:RNA polymerase sigma factor (sigma-70 family)